MTALALALVLLSAVVPVAAAQDAGAGRNILHVTGLTKLNFGVVEIALEGISHRWWHCVECNATQLAQGDCPQCKQPLVPVEQTLLSDVEIDLEAGTIAFEVLPEQAVRLSEIQAALTRYKIVIPPERQVIPHAGTLVVAGPSTKEEVAKLVTTLQKSPHFEKVAGSLAADGQHAELAVRCAGSPRRPDVEKALAEACAACTLSDIVWTSGAAGSSRR